MKYQYLEPEKILDGDDFDFILKFLQETGRGQVGWHYVVDLAWIYSHAKDWPSNYQVLDAGGGNGPTQFLLTEMGFNVTNIDLVIRMPKARIRNRYQMTYETVPSYQNTPYVEHLESNYLKLRLLKGLRKAVNEFVLYKYISTINYHRVHEKWRSGAGISHSIGRLDWKRANLCNIPEVPSNSFDAVVSLSSLEHIPIQSLSHAWEEIIRMCKPESKVAITTSATEQDITWFHEPSKGYCFSASDIHSLFGALPNEGCPPGDRMIEKYWSCAYLKNNLADFYSKSTENGMPLGFWDPKYFPVGLFR